MTTMELNAEIFRQLSYIADEKSYMDKVLAYIKELVKQRENEDNAALSIAAEEPAPYYMRPALPKCCWRATTAASSFCLRSLRLGRTAPSVICGRAAASSFRRRGATGA